jgi:hypothetical protein
MAYKVNDMSAYEGHNRGSFDYLLLAVLSLAGIVPDPIWMQERPKSSFHSG